MMHRTLLLYVYIRNCSFLDRPRLNTCASHDWFRPLTLHPAWQLRPLLLPCDATPPEIDFRSQSELYRLPPSPPLSSFRHDSVEFVLYHWPVFFAVNSNTSLSLFHPFLITL